MLKIERKNVQKSCTFLTGKATIDVWNVSIRPATGIEPLYIAIATVTINLIVAVAIILLNLYVAVSAGPRIPPLVLSIHFLDVAASICAGAVPAVPHELPFYNKAFGR